MHVKGEEILTMDEEHVKHHFYIYNNTSELFSTFHSLLMIIPITFDLHLVVIA